jgi:hypothetical protein
MKYYGMQTVIPVSIAYENSLRSADEQCIV